MDKYQEFDNEIFDITRIMLDFSLTEGQKSELREVMEEMETAHREGLLTDAQHGRLLCMMADCGMDCPGRCGSGGAGKAAVRLHGI